MNGILEGCLLVVVDLVASSGVSSCLTLAMAMSRNWWSYSENRKVGRDGQEALASLKADYLPAQAHGFLFRHKVLLFPKSPVKETGIFLDSDFWTPPPTPPKKLCKNNSDLRAKFGLIFNLGLVKSRYARVDQTQV